MKSYAWFMALVLCKCACGGAHASDYIELRPGYTAAPPAASVSSTHAAGLVEGARSLAAVVNGWGIKMSNDHAFDEAHEKAAILARQIGRDQTINVTVDFYRPSTDAPDSIFDPVNTQTFVSGTGRTREEAFDDARSKDAIRPGISESGRTFAGKIILSFSSTDLLKEDSARAQEAIRRSVAKDQASRPLPHRRSVPFPDRLYYSPAEIDKGIERDRLFDQYFRMRKTA